MNLKLTAIAALIITLAACKKSDTTTTPNNNSTSPLASKIVIRSGVADSSVETITWDANRRPTQLAQSNTTSGSTMTATLTYSRNSSGVLTGWTVAGISSTVNVVVHSNASGQYTDRVYYTSGIPYDSLTLTYSGGKISGGVEYQGFGSYSPIDSVAYTYDASGNLTKQELYNYSSGWVLAERRSYTYDTYSNPIPFNSDIQLSGAVGIGGNNITGVGPNNPATFTDQNIGTSTTTTTTYVYTYNGLVPSAATGAQSPGGATTTTTYTY